MSAWAAMNGYGLYVWGAFGMCALVIAAELLQLNARRRQLHQRVADEDAACAAGPAQGESRSPSGRRVVQ